MTEDLAGSDRHASAVADLLEDGASAADPGAIVKHVVMWDVAGTGAERTANIALVKRLFEGLRGKIPGLLTLEIEEDRSGIDYACDLILYTEFADEASLAAYAGHPAHRAVRDQLAGIRIRRHQVDYRARRAR